MTGVVIDPTDRFRGLTQYDVHIIAYTSLFRIVNKFHQAVFSDPNVPNGLNRSIDFRAVTLEHDRLLSNYRQEWAERFERDSDHSGARVLRIWLPTSRCFSDIFRSWYRCGLRVPREASAIVRS
jgi:hypothetical protein